MYYRLNSKGQVERHRAIDSRQMQKQGVLQAGMSGTYCWWDSATGEKKASIAYTTGQDHITLNYSVNNQPQHYTILLERTACHYGGSRTWFLCPAKGCGKRVAKLYISSSIFACRHCQQLNYASQQASKADLSLLKMHNIRDKLGWPYAYVTALQRFTKPKHMHYTTWRKLVALQDQYERQMCITWTNRLDRLASRLE